MNPKKELLRKAPQAQQAVLRMRQNRDSSYVSPSRKTPKPLNSLSGFTKL